MSVCVRVCMNGVDFRSIHHDFSLPGQDRFLVVYVLSVRLHGVEVPFDNNYNRIYNIGCATVFCRFTVFNWYDYEKTKKHVGSPYILYVQYVAGLQHNIGDIDKFQYSQIKVFTLINNYTYIINKQIIVFWNVELSFQDSYQRYFGL